MADQIIGELTQGSAPVIKDVTTQTFAVDVLEASVETPIIVDFWAPWCGPCKQLGPLLEKVVKTANNAVRLVKIDIDKCPEIAQQLRVQSIPAVFAFFGGRPVDGFVGVVPESQIKTFVERIVAVAGGSIGPSPIDQALEQAAAALEAGDAATAGQHYAEILKVEPDHPGANAGLAHYYIASSQSEKARTHIDALPPEVAKHAEIGAVRATLDLAQEANKTRGEVPELQARIAENANDHQARFDLALALYAAQQIEAAIDELLALVERDRNWNDEAARKQLLKIFEALGHSDPITVEARRRLSSLLFS
jgi:putative thioredoxin